MSDGESAPTNRLRWKRVLLTLCNKRTLAPVTAFFAFFALFFAFLSNTVVGVYKISSEIKEDQWLEHYMLWLENQENQEMKEKAENYLKVSLDHTLISFAHEARMGMWQMSAQVFILSLMFNLVGSSIGKRSKWKLTINFANVLFFVCGIIIFVYPIVAIPLT